MQVRGHAEKCLNVLPDKDTETKWCYDHQLYNYAFFKKDAKTEEIAKKINGNLQDLDIGVDDDSSEPLPHLSDTKDWETWKTRMITMKPDMEEHSKMLALYMHCMLQ